MAFDVFISHSNADRATANAAVHVLEARGIRCWIAPRDIEPGSNWGASIIAGLSECRVFVLIFSKNSNGSQQVLQEVERAVAKGLIIVPVRVELIEPSPSLELYIGARHWLDAMTAPLEAHLHRLADSVGRVLGRTGGQPTEDVTPATQSVPGAAPQPALRRAEPDSSRAPSQGPSPYPSQAPLQSRRAAPGSTAHTASTRQAPAAQVVGPPPSARPSSQVAAPARPGGAAGPVAHGPVTSAPRAQAVAPPRSAAWRTVRRGMYSLMALLVAIGGVFGAWTIAPRLGLWESSGGRGDDAARRHASGEAELKSGGDSPRTTEQPRGPSPAMPPAKPPSVEPAVKAGPPRADTGVAGATPAPAASNAPTVRDADTDWRNAPLIDSAPGSSEIATTVPRGRPVYRRLVLETPATVGLSLTASHKDWLAVATFGIDRDENGLIDDGERFTHLEAASGRTDSGSYVVPAGRYLLRLESKESGPVVLRVAVTSHPSSEAEDPGQTPEGTRAVIPSNGDHEITEQVGLRANIDLADWFRLEVVTIVRLTCSITDTGPHAEAVLVRDRDADGLLAPDETVATVASEATGTSMVEYLAPGRYAIGVIPTRNNARPSLMYTLRTRVEALPALPVDPGDSIDSAVEVAIAAGGTIELRDGIGAVDSEDLFKLVAQENLAITLFVEASDPRRSGFSRSVLFDRDGNGLLDREIDLMRSGDVRGEEPRKATLALEKGRPLYLSITRDSPSGRYMPYGVRVVAAGAESAELDAPSQLDKSAPAIQIGQTGKPVHGYVGPGDRRDVLTFRLSTPSDIVISAQSSVSQIFVELVRDKNGNEAIDDGERIKYCQPGPGDGRKIEERLAERGDYFIVVTDQKADSREDAAGSFYSITVTATRVPK